VNLVILEKLEHRVNVVPQEKKVNEVTMAHKVILVVLVKLVNPVAMVLMVNLVLKEIKENQLEFHLYKECQEKKEHQVLLA
jgi:hypothetical protein